MIAIPDTYMPLLEGKALYVLATLMPDGDPQVTPVWGMVRDGNIVINTATGRQKDRNLEARPHATILVLNPDNSQDWIEIRGRVIERTTEGADADIDALAKKYIGADRYPWRQPGEQRVTYVIEPVKIAHGG